jgi:hypothetical protein
MDFLDLTDEEIEALAMHEHVPLIVASELGSYLLQSPDGIPMIKRAIIDDIEEAEGRGDTAQATRLRATLAHFVATHPLRESVSAQGSNDEADTD